MTDSAKDEDALFQAVQSYLQELEKGKKPDRREWLARYPDLASELGDCLDGLLLMREGAASLSGDPRRGREMGAGLEPGIPLGDFQIVREIGRGGMGIVYEAVQLSLGRRVALKVLPFAASLDLKYVKRFQQEAQAAAQLHHSHIVPVHAVGCERGVNFYAMQLIDGIALDSIIRQLRQDIATASERNPPSNPASPQRKDCRLEMPLTEEFAQLTESLRVETPVEEASADPTITNGSPAESTIDSISADFSTQHSSDQMQFQRFAAQLMAQAAEALEYAHKQGIVHRDIKPANLLIDSGRNLWITDFGLAHLRGEQNLTRTGDLLGTLRYSSPEQVSGQRVVLDHRTDLYSLGATFYELITLRPVFSGETQQAILHQLLNEEPVAPRSIKRSIAPELETILLKLLSKIPGERYGSAQELADDLHRFLRDEPILACPPSAAERLRKWGRRHPAYVIAAVLVMFVTLVISGVSNWLIGRANIRAQDALAAERIRAEEAESRLSLARQAVDLLIEVSENDLDKPFFQTVRKRLLESALAFYQAFVAQNVSNPSREAELMAVQRRLSKVLDDLAAMEGAGQLLLLNEKSVQADLALGPSERQQIDAMARQFFDERMGLLQRYPGLSPNDRHERYLTLARTYDRSLRSLLSSGQFSRLRQIHIQTIGPMAFSEPDVVQSLKLADSQRRAVRQILVESILLPGEHPELKDETARGELQKSLLKSAMEKLLALLTPEQSARWKDLVSPPFRGSISRPPPMPPSAG
jgi:eukaryotic-like serine/threonine-protein kinase